MIASAPHSLDAVAAAPASAAAEAQPWLFSARHDLGWAMAAILLPLLVYLPPYWAWGGAAVWPMYLVYVAAFATPHTWFTYAVMATPSGHGHYSRATLWVPLAMALGLVALFPLAAWLGTWAWDAFFTATVLIGYHHVWKQHLGLWKLYDRRYLAHSDAGAEKPLAWLRGAGTVAFLAPLLYVWGQPQVKVVVDKQAFTLLHPMLPEFAWALLAGLCAVVALGAVVALRPGRPGRPWPVGQFSVLAVGALSYGLAFALIAPQHFLLSVALFITAHDLQYGGFVWGFQRGRAQAEAAQGQSLDRVHTWALKGHWLPYFGAAFVFSALVVGAIAVSPEGLALALVVFHNHLHYFVDRFAWRREHNPALGRHMAGKPA